MAALLEYNSKYHDAWAWSLALKGATNDEIAEAFGISKRTIIRWTQTYPSFADAIERGKNGADAQIEKKLFERALGFSVTETKKVVDVDKNGNTKPVRVETYEKKVAPDTMAIMYWLNNRKKKTGEWSQNQSITLSGSVDTGPDLSKLSEEELRALARSASDGEERE